MSARKVYFGEYDMPHEIEAAAHAFYEAVRKCGYFTASVDVCPDQNSCGVHLSTRDGCSITESIKAELHEGKWQLVGWVDSDD